MGGLGTVQGERGEGERVGKCSTREGKENDMVHMYVKGTKERTGKRNGGGKRKAKGD